MLLDLDARRLVGPRRWTRLRAGRRAAARGRRLRPDRSATTTAFGGPLPLTGLLVDQQAALFARGLPASRDRPSARTAPGPSCWPTSGPAPRRSTAGLTDLGRLAAGRAYDVLPGRAGLHRRRRRCAGWSTSASSPAPRTSTGSGSAVARLRRRDVRPRARRARRAVVARRRARLADRARPRHRRPAHLVRALVEGIAAPGRRAGSLRVAADLGSPLTTPARRRRPDPVSRCSCRPRPTCCRCRSRSSRRPTRPRWASAAAARLGPRPEPGVADGAAGRGSRPRSYEPRIGADEAAERQDGPGAPRRDGVAAAGERGADDDGVRRRTTSRSSAPASSAARSLASWRARLPGRAARRRATTSARARRRPTPPSCTPASTPRPARWRPGWCAAATTLLSDYAAAAGIPVERAGALLVAWDEEQLAALPGLADEGRGERLRRAPRSVSARGALRRGAARSDRARSARLVVPDESIICPWTTTARLRDRGGAGRRRPAARPPGGRRRRHADGGHLLRTCEGRAAGQLGGQRGRPATATTSTGCSATTTSP